MISHPLVAEWAVRVTLVVFLFELGGGLYENVVVDPVWPKNPKIVKPGDGGLNRKMFWGPLHGIATIALPVAVWAGFGDPQARAWLLVSLGVYVAMRVWTFAYFIPGAIRQETTEDVTREEAQRWVRWSSLRAPLLITATIALWRASVWLGRGAVL